MGPVMITSGIRTMRSLVQAALCPDQMAAEFAVELSVLGTFLAALGLYGVIAYIVSKRRQEMGLAWLKVRNGERLCAWRSVKVEDAAFGMVVGLAVSLAAVRLLSSALYGVKPTAAISFVGSAVVVILVADAASYVPARRAAKVDPMVVLRSEYVKKTLSPVTC